MPLLQATNRTMLNPIALDPADFISHYPYLFSDLDTYDTIALPTLTVVNAAAVEYYAAVEAQSEAETEGDDALTERPLSLTRQLSVGIPQCVHVHHARTPV